MHQFIINAVRARALGTVILASQIATAFSSSYSCPIAKDFLSTWEDSRMYQPEPLKPGDTIRIVTPAGPVRDQKKLLDSIEELQKEDYVVELDKNIFHVNGYLAGTDQERAASLMEAFRGSRVKGIICSRGSYGTARLSPYLDLDQMAKSKKMFVGFSDLTFLHQPLNKRVLVTY